MGSLLFLKNGAFYRPTCCASYRQNIITSPHSDTTSLLGVSSPVRNDRLRCEIIWLLCLGLIFVIGLTTGIYLLYTETDEESFTLITRTDWNAAPSKRNLTKPDLPMKGVEMFPLIPIGTRCENDTSCFPFLKDLQHDHVNILGKADIAFNFLLDNGGGVYEGRGWEYFPGETEGDGSNLSIGLIGNSGDEQLSDKQLKTLGAFLDYAVIQKRLVPCFEITVYRALKRDVVIREVVEQIKRRRRC